MAQLIRLADHPAAQNRRARPIHFSRAEINQLLSLYARRVAAGEWRDYAIDCRPGMAIFAAFRGTNQRPALTVQKLPQAFVVTADDRGRCQAATLGDALAAWEPRLTLAKS